jgi:RecA-family ATPase
LPLHAKEFFYSLEEWEAINLETLDNEVLIGTPSNSIIRPGTKNIVLAPEKTFKTTTVLRLAIGMASDYTVFPSLPVARAVRVLYIHGEMTPKELDERRRAALRDIPLKALAVGKSNFIDGRSLDAHLVNTPGQEAIRRVVRELNPNVLVLDPWQSFIAGCDENLFKDVSNATSFLDHLIAEQQGMTVLLVVHLGKNAGRGARGHSSLSGWRDTLIQLTKKDDKTIKVEVRPRWGEPASFKLKFDHGTMIEERLFSPQSARIRKFLEDKNCWVPRAEIDQFLGGHKEATKKAIQRAVAEEAIIEGKGDNIGKFNPRWDSDEFFDLPVT